MANTMQRKQECGLASSSLPVVADVDLRRFMGEWFVISSIPTFAEKDAHNAVERYSLDDDGTVVTSFSFHKGGFDGKLVAHESRGFVRDSSNAIWGMQFLWPFKADYRIAYLNDDYTQAVIGRSKRDFAWIMAREPTISNADYFQRVNFLRDHGYDTNKLKLVPQRWGDASASVRSQNPDD